MTEEKEEKQIVAITDQKKKKKKDQRLYAIKMIIKVLIKKYLIEQLQKDLMK